ATTPTSCATMSACSPPGRWCRGWCRRRRAATACPRPRSTRPQRTRASWSGPASWSRRRRAAGAHRWGGASATPAQAHSSAGPSGCGKSTFFYNLAVQAVRGEDFLGFPFARPLRVMYIDLETPDRLRATKLARITDWPPPCGLAFRRETTLPRDLDAVIAEV